MRTNVTKEEIEQIVRNCVTFHNTPHAQIIKSYALENLLVEVIWEKLVERSVEAEPVIGLKIQE